MPIDRPDRHTFFRLGGSLGLPRMGGWGLVALVGLLQAAPDPFLEDSSAGPDWIDVRMEKVLRREDAGIPHCESMVRHQRELALLRDTIGRIVHQGREARASCQSRPAALQRQACSDSLNPLRREVAEKVRSERRIQDSVGRHASACNPAAYKAWQDLEILRQDSAGGIDIGFGSCPDVPPPRPDYDRLVEIEIASVWLRERRARERTRGAAEVGSDTSLSTGFRDRIRGYARRRGASNPSAQTHFLLAVLDHREGREESALSRLRRIPARDSSTVWKAPVALLYGQILSRRSPDSAMALLRSAVSDSSLAAPARFLLGRLSWTKGDLLGATAEFSRYLELPAAPGPGNRAQVVGLAARVLSERLQSPARDDAPGSVRAFLRDSLPTSARDTVALGVARNLLAAGKPVAAIEVLSSFQVDHPGTKLGNEARSLLSRVRRGQANRERR